MREIPLPLLFAQTSIKNKFGKKYKTLINCNIKQYNKDMAI